MGGSWEEVMSWVMADRVGQSEHHYSAGWVFFLTQDYFSTAVRHFAELFTCLSVGIWGKATAGCGVRLHLMLKKILMKETDCRERNMSTLCPCSGRTPCYHFETSALITQI